MVSHEVNVKFDSAWCERRCRELGLGLGGSIDHRALTESTNDDALAWAKQGAAHGSVVVADVQTRGRGRRGSAWASPAGEGLTFSLILRLELAVAELSVLPLVVGLGLREVVARRVASPVLVKWPNDVLVNGLKLAGILVETQFRGQRAEAVVVGVGLNVFTREFEGELARAATSLWQLGARAETRTQLLVELLAACDRRCQELSLRGFAEQWRELNEFDALKGRHVRVDRIQGVASGIAENGALYVTHAGRRHEVLAGSVHLDPAEPA